MADNEKRSSHDLIPGADDPAQGVGGRQGSMPPPLEGGGYPDICNISGSDFTAELRKSDPRLHELREAGVSETWVQIAQLIGFEAFIGVWIHLGGDVSRRIRVPPYSKYLKFRRDQLIRHLGREGKKPEQIRRLVRHELCEQVSTRHIQRVVSKDRIKHHE